MFYVGSRFCYPIFVCKFFEEIEVPQQDLKNI